MNKGTDGNEAVKCDGIDMRISKEMKILSIKIDKGLSCNKLLKRVF